MPPFDSRELGRLAGSGLDVVASRNQAKGFDPRSGEGARRFGGRFNPPHSFPVLYLCLSQPCVVAEFTRQAERQSLSVEDLLPRELWKIVVGLNKVLDLSDAVTHNALGLDSADLTRDEHSFTQNIGEAAHEHGFQAIRSPSVTGVDEVLAIFPENLTGAVLRVELVREWRTIDDLAL
ncbi:MAG TPA: RES family NAD+ phosphorylase [Acidimicrobiia bacterium]|nr:RES family NAD+ phosphorylase [Acidimicrobiia bacterium]